MAAIPSARRLAPGAVGRSLLLALLLVWPEWLAAQPDAPLLFTPVAASAPAVPAPQGQFMDGVRRRVSARPRPTALRDARRVAAERVTLNLFDDLRVVARRQQSVALDEDGLYWAGEVEGDTEGHAAFVLRGSWLAGHVHARGRTVLIQSQPDGLHLVEEVDPATQPSCGGGLAPHAGPSTPGVGATSSVGAGLVRPAAAQPPPAASHGPTIDLLVVYSPQARLEAGAAALRTSIDLAVMQMNQALTNSAVAGHVRLVAARELAQPESGSMIIDLNRLTERQDGWYDEVHAWRNELGADMVSLITDQASEKWAGLAWIMTDINSSFAGYAFSVVRRQWLTDYTLAHELGHNLGLAHDFDNSQGQAGVFPYAYAYRDPPFFRDLMSYACSGPPCPQIGHFSNPNVFYQGRPTGTAAREDAARALRQTLPIAAAFRSGMPPVLTNVLPGSGPTLGGERVRLQGERLGAVTRVWFGTFAGTDPMLEVTGELSVVVPSQPQRVVDVRVEDLEGRSSTLAASFSYVPGPGDADGDALPDTWEEAMGLDPTDATGVNGADGDANGNGISNFNSYRTHRHPRAFHQRYFAEGASSTFFDTRVALLNPGNTPAGAVLRYQLGDGTIQGTWLDMPPRTRRTVNVGAASGMAGAEFSTVIESDQPLVVDRTMSWDVAHGYGAHAETSVLTPSTTWYLAEGATHSGFRLFYLLQNPAATAATVRVRYLRPEGAPLEKTYVLPPTSRTNIWVNIETFSGIGQALASTEVSAVIDSSLPIIVERAMYLDGQGVMFNAGHASAGVTAPALQWFLAEGATGSYFDLFVLIANPGQADASVELSYLLGDGTTYSRTVVARAGSRTSVWVDWEQFEGVPGYPLADVAVSTTVRSTNGVPIIVERAMWWPGDVSTWHEAHNSAGSTATGTRWALAEGEVGGPRNVETYILIANTSAFDGSATVTLLFEDGSSVARAYALRANSRTNVPVGDLAHFGVEAQGRRFSAIVESTGPTPAQIVVERAMYWDALGRLWAAGTNALGTRLQ